MPDTRRLRALCDRIDGRSYPAYRDLKGRWELGPLTLHIDHVQGDPFAAPSRLRVEVPTGIDVSLCTDPDARLAAEDWLLRRFRPSGRSRGSGKSGQLRIYRPGPEITERSAVRLHANGTAEVRFQAGLPARGRRVLGRQAYSLLTEDVAVAVEELRAEADLDVQVASVRRQRALRRSLHDRGLVAFVADGSVLPRRSGIDARPLSDAVPFRSPPSLQVELDGVVGMGIPEGVTLIVGGGFHGKSTLLQAIQRGHLDHVPGDGREGVVALPSVVKVRAEDGRRVGDVDISPFLRTLPGGRSTAPFQTDDASGSTSQAAAIVEAVEAGSQLLLLDEDTSATNLLVRDERMRQLIARDREPITPFVERVRDLHGTWGVSTVLVIGGVGDYLAVADTVIAMTEFVASDVTEEAHGIGGVPPEAPDALSAVRPRVIAGGLAPGRKTRARDDRAVQYGDGEVDLTAVEHVLDASHAATIGQALRLLHEEVVDGRRDVRQMLDAFDAILDDEGVEVLSARDWPDGMLVRPRRFEVAAALSRLRSLRVQRR